jgi:hypothetical protein
MVVWHAHLARVIHGGRPCHFKRGFDQMVVWHAHLARVIHGRDARATSKEGSIKW